VLPEPVEEHRVPEIPTGGADPRAWSLPAVRVDQVPVPAAGVEPVTRPNRAEYLFKSATRARLRLDPESVAPTRRPSTGEPAMTSTQPTTFQAPAALATDTT
jgi:hypothetical protein